MSDYSYESYIISMAAAGPGNGVGSQESAALEVPISGDFLMVAGEDGPAFGSGYVDVRLNSLSNPVLRLRFGARIGDTKGTPFTKFYIDWPLIAGKRMGLIIGHACLFEADAGAWMSMIGNAVPPAFPGSITSNGGLPYVYSQQLSYTAGGLVEYQGYAVPGSATSAAVWVIVRFTYTGTNLTAIEFAAGSLSFNQIWDDRATLAYS